MLKKSVGIGLLCLAGQTYATVNVTTTKDVVADDKECSLREAVHYVNEYLTAKTGEKEEEKKQREEAAKKGYFGCGGEGATNTIYLEENKTYELQSEIAIKADLQLQTANEEFSVDDIKKGLQNATIKAMGTHRLFNIDDEKSEISQIKVIFSQLNLEGCGLTNICADRGGIIFNRENLTINFSKVYNGYANEGGVLYNDGLITGTSANSASTITIASSIFERNRAEKEGGVIYVGQPIFSISKSIFRENATINSRGTLIFSAEAFNSATVNTDNFTRVSVINNSNFFKNAGYLANVRDGVYINNVTAVDNNLGFSFNAPNGKAHISNSIVAGNKTTDCQYTASDQSLSFNNLVGNSCSAGEANNLNSYLGSQKLFAGTSSEGDVCDRPPAAGLLCPFTTPKEQFLGYFKPRLLSSYQALNDSPIVNRGRLYSDGTNEGFASCETADIRGYTRSGTVHCDLGAVELIISSDSVSRIGQDIRYGETANMTIINSLGDGELLPAAECAAILGTANAPDGKPWQVGCLRLEQSAITPTSKGTTTLGEHGEVVYKPAYDYHGLDEFDLRVITTTSRFSEAERDRDVVVPVRIVQSPINNFPSQTLNISGGGSFGGIGVLGLILLGLYRRKIKS